jgi:hypothetical protein
MGKKSKKGAKSGTKPRPAAGQGQRRKNRSESGTYSEDGRSVASRDDLRSYDSEPASTKPVAPPGDVTVTIMSPVKENKASNGGQKGNNKENTGSSSTVPAAPAQAVPVAEAKAAPVSSKAKELVVEAAPVPKKDGVWEGNLRDAVKADAEGPPVLDVTMDVSMEENGAATSKEAAPKAAAAVVVQSRGFSLTEPAPEEAKNKANDCACVIL